jgi:hypothetical protein
VVIPPPALPVGEPYPVPLDEVLASRDAESQSEPSSAAMQCKRPELNGTAMQSKRAVGSKRARMHLRKRGLAANANAFSMAKPLLQGGRSR